MINLSYVNGQRIWGSELRKRAEDFFSWHHIMTDTFIEYLPGPHTGISLSSTQRDIFGLPVAKIRYAPHPANSASQQQLAKYLSEFFYAMGAQGVSFSDNPFTAGEVQTGTARFGSDPETSVLNPQCRSHELKNLYVCDGSFMPSGIPIPPTFTIMANAHRVAEYIAQNG